MTLMACSGKAQNKVDLQKVAFKAGVDVREAYLKDKKRHADDAEAMTTLPAYMTYDVEGFTYGPVTFTHGSDFGATEVGGSDISFVLNSAAERKFVGLIIRIEKSDEAKKLAGYVHATYGKGTVIENTPKPNAQGEVLGTGNDLFRNIQPGFSMIMVNEYSIKDKKPAFAVILYIIKNDVPTSPNVTGFKTALDRMIASCKN